FHFAGNDYYSGADAFAIQWGDASFSTLADWANTTRQERTRTRVIGYQTNPRLVNPGHGGTLGDADLIEQLSAYRLQKRSPLVDRGRGYPDGADPTTMQDFFGEPAPLGAAVDIGVDELR